MISKVTHDPDFSLGSKTTTTKTAAIPTTSRTNATIIVLSGGAVVVDSWTIIVKVAVRLLS